MKVNIETFEGIKRPMYVLEEVRLRRNLNLVAQVAREADVEVILAFKAFALWKTFPIFKEYIRATTASSLNEARLAFEEFGSAAHTFSPAYTDDEIDAIARCSSHLQFNSLTQYARFHERSKPTQPSVLGCASIPNILRWAPRFIIPVHLAHALASRPTSCPSSCLTTSKVFIVIAIVRAAPTRLRAPCSTLRRSLRTGFRS